MDQINFEQKISITTDNSEILDEDLDTATSNFRKFGYFEDSGLILQRIEKGNNDYEIIERSFVNCVRDFVKDLEVVAIHRRNYGSSGVMASARAAVFRVFSTAVASRNGGDANLNYGWYGGSRDEICEILLYGFRERSGNRLSYGHGVYLSPAHIPIGSLSNSVVDEDGLRHVLLCRVILGNPEKISFGSQSYLPSSVEFDSGVDNLPSPNKYIIWEPYMNTHILPVFILSFKADSLTGFGSLRIPTSPHMSINNLVKLLKNHLSSSKMALITKRHHDFQRNRIPRSQLVRSLRAIAGDEVLREIVQVHR